MAIFNRRTCNDNDVMFTVFIVRQHAMHAEHDVVLPIRSVRLSNVGTVSKRMDISSDILTVW